MAAPFDLGELGKAMPSLRGTSRPFVPATHPPRQPVLRAPPKQWPPFKARTPAQTEPWSFAGSPGAFQPYWGIYFKLPAGNIGERNVELAFSRSIEAVFKRKVPHSVQLFRSKSGKVSRTATSRSPLAHLSSALKPVCCLQSRGDGSLLFGEPNLHVVYLDSLGRWPENRPSLRKKNEEIICRAERRPPDSARLAMLIQRLVQAEDENSDNEQTTIDSLEGRALSCGTWDADGNFCEGWRRTLPVSVSLEQRDAHLKITSSFFEIRE